MTIGGNYGQHGDRTPAVWVNKAKFFAIRFADSGPDANNAKYHYQLNHLYHFVVKQEENLNGEIINSIEMDGTTVLEVVNTLPQRFEKVILYASDPWYPSFASFGELKNLNIVNLDKYPA